MQALFNERANELAMQIGFIQRERKITGSNFIKTLLFGWLQNSSPSVEGLVRAGVSHDLLITAQGLDKRFTEKAANFMKSLLEEAMGQVVKAKTPVALELFKRFANVYIADCSVITLDDELHSLWEGTGGSGNTSRAALKIDACLEMKTGQLQCGLLQGKHSDNRSPLANAVYEPGSLRIQDLGYFNLERMKAQAERGEYWVSRYQINTTILDSQNEKIDLLKLLIGLKKSGIKQHECQVILGVKTKLKARLLIWHLPEEAAGRCRAKMKENAQNNGRTASQESLALCDWKLMVTNADKDLISFSECFLLYSVRWQIELLFKLWKSHGKLGNSRSENIWRTLCELYGKLLALIVQHWIVLTGFWHIPERSLVKAGQMIREQSVRLAACFNDFEALVALLSEFPKRFEVGCRLNKRNKHPNTCQQLIDGYVFS
jgi:hypothetical protein